MKRRPPKSKQAKPARRAGRKAPSAPKRESSRFDTQKQELLAQDDQRLETQHLLELARDRYMDLYDLAPIGFVILSVSGFVLELNLPGAEMLGMERSRIIGMAFHSRVAAESRRNFLEHLRRTRRGGETVTTEVKLLSSRGTRSVQLHSRVAFDRSDPEASFLLTALIDRTEQKKSEVALGLSEDRLRLALSAARAGTWDWSSPTRSLHWSKDHYALFGLEEDAFHPTFEGWIDLIHPADRARVLRGGLRETIVGSSVDVTYRTNCPDGNERWLHTIGKRIEGGEEGGTRAIGITLDITASKQAELQLKSLNAILEDRRTEAEMHATQLRSLVQELARAETREQSRLAEILHDHVQQTLVAADLNLARLARKSPDAETTSAIANVAGFIHESLRATRNLARDFNPGILKAEGLRAALIWQAEVMKEEFGLSVRIEDMTEVDPRSYEECALLFRAVRELLFNVIKHAKTKEARLRLTRQPDGDLSIEVADGGIGFDPASMSGPEAGNHNGILRIRERIQALGGRFQIQSQPGNGTTVLLIVPVEPRSRTARSGAQPSKARKGRSG
jgi:PAS domain S-box-containing protein